jgi:hypothetical protein
VQYHPSAPDELHTTHAVSEGAQHFISLSGPSEEIPELYGLPLHVRKVLADAVATTESAPLEHSTEKRQHIRRYEFGWIGFTVHHLGFTHFLLLDSVFGRTVQSRRNDFCPG